MTLLAFSKHIVRVTCEKQAAGDASGGLAEAGPKVSKTESLERHSVYGELPTQLSRKGNHA
jgi:hypothetical protein